LLGVEVGGGGFEGGGGGGAIVTLTDTESDLVGSATLVAVTVSVPAVVGALYIPDALTVPSAAFQATVLFVVVPATLAVNGSVPEVIEDAVSGDTDTEVTVGEAGAVGVTDACAEFVLSPAEVTTETTK
jgi:hypothetical protein